MNRLVLGSMYPVSGSLFGESGVDSAVITVRQYRVDGIPFYPLSVYAMVGWARIARTPQGGAWWEHSTKDDLDGGRLGSCRVVTKTCSYPIRGRGEQAE